MEISKRSYVEHVLVFTCCLVIHPTIATPTEDLELNSENAVPISRFFFPGDDSSNGNAWSHSYPRFSIALQEKLPESKRRSSFFPVRGKKVSQNVQKSETPGEKSISQENTVEATIFPVLRVPFSFYGVSHNRNADVPRFPNEAQSALENASPGELDLRGLPQKRPSSFMPMRGRKSYTNGNDLQLLKRYLSSTAHDDSLGFAYKNMIFNGPPNEGTEEINTYESDQVNYPSFHDKAQKDETDLLDRDQIEMHLKFANGDRQSLNGDPASNVKSFSGGKISSTKRALSFVPTRGRRIKPEEFASQFLPHVTMSHRDWLADFPAGQMATNLSQYSSAVGGKTHQRYRRASAFMPMRGRKSNPYWLAYNYLPQNVYQMRRFDDIGSTGNMEQQLPQAIEIQEQMFGEDTKYVGGRRQKKSFGAEGPQSSLPQQNLRTAIVMKRPLSFFAARGKRLNDEENYTL